MEGPVFAILILDLPFGVNYLLQYILILFSLFAVFNLTSPLDGKIDLPTQRVKQTFDKKWKNNLDKIPYLALVSEINKFGPRPNQCTGFLIAPSTIVVPAFFIKPYELLEDYKNLKVEISSNRNSIIHSVCNNLYVIGDSESKYHDIAIATVSSLENFMK